MTISSDQIDIHISIQGGKATVLSAEPCKECKVLQTEIGKLKSMIFSLRYHLQNVWDQTSPKNEVLDVEITRILSQTKI